MIQPNLNLWFIAPISAILALVAAYWITTKLLKAPEGNDRMKEIARYIQVGANAYLKRQYTTVSIFFVVTFFVLMALVFMGIQSIFVPFIFISGGLLSALSGFLGMKIATQSSSRTAAACQHSLNRGLQVAFRGGAVMGLMVVGFGLLGISIWFLILSYLFDHNIFGLALPLLKKMGALEWDPSLIQTSLFQSLKYSSIGAMMLAYAMGASAMALFARVGGGIFTKAADVGADLVGKVEAGIPEDDPRNPATIADNVGDNVGDVAGMGADLYESYCGSILAASALGASLALTQQAPLTAVLAPMAVAAGGVLCSIAGIFVVRTKEEASQKNLLMALFFGTGVTSVLMILFLTVLAMMSWISWGVFGAIISGLIAGVIIGQATEYYTSSNYSPTKLIAEQSQEGQSSTIIYGFATGMISTGVPVITIVVGIIAAFYFAGGSNNLLLGIYGISFSAIGMLSTLGIQLATDAFGPIADNAGGNAEMAHLPPEVRERTDALDSLGNTTAATGKGFAIGSAALTALALSAAYLDTIKLTLEKLAGDAVFFIGQLGFTNVTDLASPTEGIHLIADLDLLSILTVFQVYVINPKFLGGLFIGVMISFVFCALTMLAVGAAAGKMVHEVRRQFKEIPGIMEGTATPDYAKCVDISTSGAQRAMILPSLLAIMVPIAVGLLLHIAGVIGLLTGSLAGGFSLALMLNNAGGAWDNAKKYIESGQFGGKGTLAHKAAVTGDTVGDPFKDTAGPSLNILIKLMAIVSIVFAGLVIKFGLVF